MGQLATILFTARMIGLVFSLVLLSCKPPNAGLSDTAAVPACTVWPSHFMVTKKNSPVFESVDDLESNKNAKYVGAGTPVIRELTIVNQEKKAKLMKIVVRGGSLAGSERYWTLADNLNFRTKSVCPSNTPRKCSENAVHFCDGSGCRCIDAGNAPDDEIGNAIIDGVVTLGIGPVTFGARTLITSLGAIRIVPSAVRSVPTLFADGAIDLTKHIASPTTLNSAEAFIATNGMESFKFARSLIGKGGSFQKMDLTEVSAINYYTRLGYGDINEALRKGDAVLLKQLQPVIEAAASGLTKMTDKIFTGTVYRGAYLPANISSAYKVGSNITEKAFTSTSRSFGDKLSGNVLFVIQSKTGKMIEELSTFANEKEVLFAPGTVFKVISKTVEGKITKILMEQISP
ncbi:MAG: hypothetical protein RIR26_895 [Pseudomonadota bacterium]|jgi:hypothetical protein